MATHLASIYGTEQDRVNCAFYLKIGACRHGDRCSRKHIHPQFSQTIVLPNVYNNPAHTHEGRNMGPIELQAHFDQFYEDFYIELCKYGHLLELHVCDNVGDHLMGNVYVRYEWEAEATKAVDELNDRWYAMRPLLAELSPVSDFKEACCRQNEVGQCTREGHCNFMHLRHPSKALVKSLDASQRASRRINADKSKTGPSQDLGWTPSAARAGAWQPSGRDY
ncbi:hypothetical protein Q5752_000164 [Cryptotrichosporon argae]